MSCEIELYIQNQYTFVKGFDSIKLIQELDKHMSVFYPNYWFMSSFKNRTSDGKYHFFSKVSQCFPTGLLNRAIEFFKNKEINCKTIDNRKTIDIKSYEEVDLKSIELRDYQKEAVKAILEKKSMIVRYATNAGKTEVGIGAIQIFLRHNLKILWLTHRIPLMNQTVDRMSKRLGIKKNTIGLIGGGCWDLNKRLTVSTIQTISKHLNEKETREFLKTIDVAITDECHHVQSNSFFKTLMKIPAVYRVGLSGTVLSGEQLSDMKVMAAIGMDVITISNNYLITRGWSAAPTIYFHMIENDKLPDDLEYMDLYGKDEDNQSTLISKGVYRLGIIENDKLNNKVIEISKNCIDKGNILIIVDRIDHGNILLNKFDIKYDVRFIHGSTDPEVFKKTLKDFKKGKVKILIASPVFDEGLDVPAIRTLILACAGFSSTKLLQRVGRGLRKKEKDNFLDVHDFITDCHEYLLNHASNRLNEYLKEKFNIVKIDSNSKSEGLIE